MTMKRDKGGRAAALLELFWTFMRIGPSTFGGGYAMIPVIEREIVNGKGWIDERELADIVSLAGSAPGGVGVNAAALVGYRRAGVAGAAAAVAGVTLPTLTIVLAAALLYALFRDHPKVAAALKGVHGAIIALILMAAYKMARTSIFDRTTAALAMIAFGALLAAGTNPIYIVLAALPVGIVLLLAKRRLGMRARTDKEEPADSSASQEQPMYPEYYI